MMKTTVSNNRILWLNNQPRSYDVLNENENAMIRNRRHLIPTYENFPEKFNYGNYMPISTKLQEKVALPQAANLTKPVTSSTTINPSKPIVPNGTKLTQPGRALTSISNSIETCWLVFLVVLK